MTSHSKTVHVAVFFTRGNSLETWQRNGALERELALYRALQRRGVYVTLVTYGQRDAVQFGPHLLGMRICDNNSNLQLMKYESLLPWLHRQALKSCNVYKTNQIKGAHTALVAGWLWQRPVIVRAGYLWAESLANSESSPVRVILARTYQRIVLRWASKIIVTTEPMRQQIVFRQARLGRTGRVTVIPNYVDTDMFSPDPDVLPKEREVVFVGRLVPEKNVQLIIQALSGMNAHLTVIGEGPQRETLVELSQQMNVNVDWLGSLPNPQIPNYLRKATLFIQPSKYEGHPKTLLEAMACGVAVIGSEVPGIREIIRHGENGWLCAPEPAALQSSIERLISNKALRQELGIAARNEIIKNYDLEKIAIQEHAFLESLI